MPLPASTVEGHTNGRRDVRDPSELVKSVLPSLRDAAQFRISAEMQLGHEAFKLLDDVGEDVVTPEGISPKDLSELRELWRRGRIYFDGEKLTVKYPNPIENAMCWLLLGYFMNAKKDGDRRLMPTGSININLPRGGVKRPDGSFTVVSSRPEDKALNGFQPNIVVETQDTSGDARVAVVRQLCGGNVKINQGLVLHIENDDNRKGDEKQVVRIILERWEWTSIDVSSLEELRHATFRDSWGHRRPVQAEEVYGVDSNGELYQRSSLDPPYSKCACYLPQPVKDTYKPVGEATEVYVLFGADRVTDGVLEITYGELVSDTDDTVAVRIPLGELSRNVSDAAIAANEQARLNAKRSADPVAAAAADLKAQGEMVRNRAAQFARKRQALERGDSKEDSGPED